MNRDSTGRLRHPAGAPKSIGGQYAPDNNRGGAAISSVKLSVSESEQADTGVISGTLMEKVSRRLDEVPADRFELYTPTPNAVLSATARQQIELGEMTDEVWGEIDDITYEQREEASETIANDVLRDLGHSNPSAAAIASVAYLVRERDSTSYANIFRSTAHDGRAQ